MRRRLECLQSEPPRWGGNGQSKSFCHWQAKRPRTNQRLAYFSQNRLMGIACFQNWQLFSKYVFQEFMSFFLLDGKLELKNKKKPGKMLEHKTKVLSH